MLQQLINHSPDLRQLRDDGYEMELRSGFLLVHHIPYISPRRTVEWGVLVSELTLANNLTTARPGTHVIYFIGEFPHYKDGTPITAIQHVSANQVLAGDLLANHSFSSKPQTGYPDYYAKISQYAAIISDPAKSMDPTVSEKTFPVIPDSENAGVFQYIDTNSSRARVNQINEKLKNQKVAIVGLGGTGAYILDLVSKSPVHEIHLFDGDDFLQHNAFRSPGAASMDQLGQRQKKVAYYSQVYSKMHKGIVPHGYFLNCENCAELASMSFVFIAVDLNSVRQTLIRELLSRNIPFIDVGLGVLTVDDSLIGTLRCTVGTMDKCDHLPGRIGSVDSEQKDAYSTNIQIADLNALNAAFAVIKWKKIFGFYQDLEKEHHSTFFINVGQLINEDCTA